MGILQFSKGNEKMWQQKDKAGHCKFYIHTKWKKAVNLFIYVFIHSFIQSITESFIFQII